MHCPGDENIIPLYRPEASDSEAEEALPADNAQPKIGISEQDMNVLRAENERHFQFMTDQEDTTDWLSDDEYEEPEMNPKYSSDMFTITNVDISNTNVKSQTIKGLSAQNALFSPDLIHQVPILFDLGTTKSIIKPIEAYTEHIGFPEVITIGHNPRVNIVGIGHVGGLKDVLQPESLSTPALLSFTNCLESWPNSFVLINAGKATIFETSMDKQYQSTAELRKNIPNMPIIAEFFQFGNMYVAPNYNFLYILEKQVTKNQ